MASFASLLVPGVTIPTPDTSWISGAADTIVGGIDKYKQNKSFNKLADLIGQQPQAQQSAAQPGLMTQPQQQSMAAPVMPVERGPLDGYLASIRTAESGGNDGAKNPRSTATGRYQFTEGTWNDLASKRPELALTADGRLDPNQQERAIRAFTQDNAQTLSRAGVPVNPGTLYAAHFLGAGGATNVLGQSDDTPVAAIVGPDVVNANPFLNGMTVGDFKQWTAQKGGGGNGGYAAPTASEAINAQAPGGMGSPMTDQAFDGRFGETALPGQVAQGMGGLASALTEANAAGVAPQPAADPVQTGVVQRDPLSTANAQPISTPPAQASAGFAGVPGIQPIPRGGVPIELIQTMLRDPNLREIGVKLWAQNVEGPKASEPFQFVTLPDGTFARANQQTGQVEPLGNFAKNGTRLGESEAGLNLVYGQDRDGNTIAFQPLKGGGLRQVEIPEGARLTPGISNIDTGTGTLTVNNKTGLPVMQTTKDLSGAEREKAKGKALGDAQVNLGSSLQKADYSIALIDQMLAHPGLETAVGLSGTLDPRNYLSGTDATDFNVRRKQLEGRAFLEAFDSLKGAGQITEIEGQKATEAIARLSTAQSEGSYKLALRELREILEVGKERARQRATVSDDAPTVPAERKTSSGVQWKIEE